MIDTRLRTFDFGEILDGAFTLYRRNFAALFGTALLIELPLIVFWLLAPLAVAPGGDGDMIAQLGTLITTPYSVVATVVMLGALTFGVWSGYTEDRVGIGESIAAGFRRFLPVAVGVVVAWTLTVFGLLLLIIPGLILLAGYFAILPAAVIEERGPFDSLGRSRALAKGARLRILAALGLGYLITMLPILAISMVAGVGLASGLFAGASAAAFEGAWGLGMAQALMLVLSALTYPFFMAVTVLLYVDRRARTEAPDLEAAAARLAAQG